MEATVSQNVDTPDNTAAASDGVVELIELLYFGYRDFISDPDTLLEDFGFGRAHHRVIHFVGRNPGINVAELLDLLRITKQSLARVLRELVQRGIIEQRSADEDRRKRLLHLTQEGVALHGKLMAPQMERIRRALQHAGLDSAEVFEQVLYGLVNEADRDVVRRVVGS